MEQQPTPETEMIQMPDSVRETAEAAKRDREVVTEAERELGRAASRMIAESINDSRPEGMPSSLPSDEVPEYTELSASTVRSRR